MWPLNFRRIKDRSILARRTSITQPLTVSTYLHCTLRFANIIMLQSAAAQSSPVPTSAATAGYLKEKMRNARTALLEKGLYLGDTSIVNQVCWVRIGKADRVVTNDAAAEY